MKALRIEPTANGRRSSFRTVANFVHFFVSASYTNFTAYSLPDIKSTLFPVVGFTGTGDMGTP